MGKETKKRILVMFFGSVTVALITVIVTLAFLETGLFSITRNVFLAVVLFLVLYIAWIKVYSRYEKIYKLGLG